MTYADLNGNDERKYSSKYIPEIKNRRQTKKIISNPLKSFENSIIYMQYYRKYLFISFYVGNYISKFS